MHELDIHRGTSLTVVKDTSLTVAKAPGTLAAVPTPPQSTPPRGAARGTPNGRSRVAIAVVIASLVAAVAVGAAVFGGSGGASSSGAASGARSTLAASVTNSASASSVSFTMNATQTTASSVTTLLSGSGSADLSTHVGQLSASIPALSTATSGLAGSSVDLLTDGSNLYLQVPGLSALTGGKRWVEVSMADAASTAGVPGGAPTLSVLTDPTQALALLGSLGAPVTTVGSVTLHGASTTEYKTTITGAELIAQLTKHGQLPGSTGTGVLKQLTSVSVPVTAWVGKDGYLKQLSVSLDLRHVTLGGLLGKLVPSAAASTTPTAGSTTTVTVGFSHYGAPVTVSVPPSSDVVNLNSILSTIGGAFGKAGSALSGLMAKV